MYLQAFSQAAAQFTRSSILVIGDIMLDRYIQGDVARISPEAPVPVVLVEKETAHLGGASNVANNLRALGCKVFLAGVVGGDLQGRELKKIAQSKGIDTGCLVETKRPTTSKTRIIARGQQVLRVDMEENIPVDEKAGEGLLSSIKGVLPMIDGLIISDYAKGVISKKLISPIIKEAGERNIPIFVDPKPKNKRFYDFVDYITPNLSEAEQMTGVEITGKADIEQAARIIKKELSCKAVLITMGSRGMGLLDKEMDFLSIETFAKEIFDVTGAGDTVIAAFALSIIAGLSPREAAHISNAAAGIVVGKLGTATVSTDEIRDYFKKR